MDYANAASPQTELSSNLHAIRNQFAEFERQIHRMTGRLDRKNAQMIHFPSVDRAVGMTSGVRDESLVRPQQPLIAELNDLTTRIDMALSQLSETINITESI